jgi:hypothetical protein
MSGLLGLLKDIGLNVLQSRRCIAALRGYVSEADISRHAETVAAVTVTRFVRACARVNKTGKSYSEVALEVAAADSKLEHAQHVATAAAGEDGGADGKSGDKSPSKARRRASIVKNKKLFRPSVYDGRLEFEGYLEKRSSGVRGGRWQRRFFSVRGNYLKYFPDEHKDVIKATYDLRDLTALLVVPVQWEVRSLFFLFLFDIAWLAACCVLLAACCLACCLLLAACYLLLLLAAFPRAATLFAPRLTPLHNDFRTSLLLRAMRSSWHSTREPCGCVPRMTRRQTSGSRHWSSGRSRPR